MENRKNQRTQSAFVVYQIRAVVGAQYNEELDAFTKSAASL